MGGRRPPGRRRHERNRPLPRGARRSESTISRHIGRRRTRQRSQPEGRDPHRGARSRGPLQARAIERGPTEGREPPKSFVSGFAKRVRLTDGGRCRAQGSLRGRIARLSDGLRREDASHVTHAVRLGPATVATRSICPSSRQGRLPLARKLGCCQSGRSGFADLPGELGAVAPDRVQNDGKLARDGDRGSLPSDTLGEPFGPFLERAVATHAGHEHPRSLVEIGAQERIVGLADASDPLALAGLVLP